MSINRVVVLGRLTRDPELRATITKGTPATNLTVAVDRRPGESGEKVTDFLDVVIFGKLAEVVCQYTKKGNLLGIDGRLQKRSFEMKDGQKRSVVEIVAENVQFLTPKGKQEETEEGFEEKEEPGE